MTSVLVVEDTAHMRRMIATMLELDGFEIAATCASGEEAIARIDRIDADVAIVDHMMPGLHGVGTAAALGELAPDLPIILYTAFLDDEIERAAARVGISACVPKTDGIDRLAQTIRQLLAVDAAQRASRNS